MKTTKPLVPIIEKGVILGSWTRHCQGKLPSMRYIPFYDVMEMEPYKFIEILVKEMKIKGIVVGQNYRFGNNKVNKKYLSSTW